MVIVAPSLRFVGGQAIQAQRLLDYLRRTPGFEVEFLPHDPEVPRALQWTQSISGLRTLVRNTVYVGSLLARLARYDVVHVFSAAYWSYFLQPMPAILVARLFRKAVVLNYRSGELEDHLTRWPAFVRWTMGLATIITPTPYLTDVYARFGLSAGVIPNYLDLEQRPYRVRDPLRPVFLVNRNFEPLYNHRCALEAFQRIQAAVPSARLILAGHGPLRAQIEAWIAELGLRDVELRGRVTQGQMMELYQEADLYLNTPDLDCFPGSVLEAFAAGTPVVTTNAGGIRHIVEHDRTGWMVECGDSAGLADGALRMLADPDYARRLAAAAREELERRYVWDVVGPQWTRTYATLASRVA